MHHKPNLTQALVAVGHLMGKLNGQVHCLCLNSLQASVVEMSSLVATQGDVSTD